MTTPGRFFVAFCALVAVSPGVTSAKPRHTKFEDAVKRCPIIVVAKLSATQPHEATETSSLDVVRVLRGELKSGTHTVGYRDVPSVDAKGGEFVAFLDEKLNWLFVAEPAGGGKTVDGSVLLIRGFNDTNAHIVTPGLVTERQLAAYLKDGSLVYSFRGPVFFPQAGKPGWKAGSLTVAGTYDAVKGKVAVGGLPRLDGFPEQPEVEVSGMREGALISLTYSRQLSRPLQFRGEVEGLDGRTGDYLLRFAVEKPEVLTEKAFGEYVADARNGGCVSTFRLTCTPVAGSAAPKALSLALGRWAENGWGSYQVDGWEKESLLARALECHGRGGHYGAHFSKPGEMPFPEVVERELAREDGLVRVAAKTKAGETLLLIFDVGGPFPPARGPFVWSFRTELTYALYVGEIKGTIAVADGKKMNVVASFTTTFESTSFNIRKKQKRP